MDKITKEITLGVNALKVAEAEIDKANIIATVVGEFYDTLKNADMPEDLCKELTLMWLGKYKGFDSE